MQYKRGQKLLTHVVWANASSPRNEVGYLHVYVIFGHIRRPQR